MAQLGIHTTSRFFVLGQNDVGIVESRKARRRVFLDIDDDYTLRLIRAALTQRRFEVSVGPCRGMEEVKIPSCCGFQWAEYERIDWPAVFAGKHGASSYCIRKGLSRKAQLALYTRKYTTKNPGSVLRTAIPETVIVDTWPVWDRNGSMGNCNGFADIIAGAGSTNASRRETLDQCLLGAKMHIDEAERLFEETATSAGSTAPIWILKGSTVNKGQGIHIIHLYEQIVDICWSSPDIREWVLQRYISKPLLLQKKKFHLRCYVLAVSALRVFLCTDFLALRATKRYSETNTDDSKAHITNTAFQNDMNSSFDEDENVLLWHEEEIIDMLIRDRSCGSKKEAIMRVENVIDDVAKITAELFRCYLAEYGVFAPIDGCFEHYGLDFLVDQSWNVYLLEVNPGPDFKQTGARLDTVVQELMLATVDVALLGKQSERLSNLRLVFEANSPNRGDCGMRINESQRAS